MRLPPVSAPLLLPACLLFVLLLPSAADAAADDIIRPSDLQALKHVEEYLDTVLPGTQQNEDGEPGFELESDQSAPVAPHEHLEEVILPPVIMTPPPATTPPVSIPVPLAPLTVDGAEIVLPRQGV